MNKKLFVLAFLLLPFAPLCLHAQSPPSVALTGAPAGVHSLKITILSTMLADEGIGEWGFAALVETDGHRILFDTGAPPFADAFVRQHGGENCDLQGMNPGGSAG